MQRTAGAVLVCFLFILLAGFVVAGPAMAPPPLKKEIHTAKPSLNYIWISGHWKWTEGKYIWAPDRWAKARKGMSWVPGHWEERSRHWVYVKNHWRKR